jgi:hypothetical protein
MPRVYTSDSRRQAKTVAGASTFASYVSKASSGGRVALMTACGGGEAGTAKLLTVAVMRVASPVAVDCSG